MLLFKKRVVEAIRSGQKRSTVRRGDRPRVRAGQGVHWPGIGRVVSRSIGTTRLADLRRADAIVDGFGSLTDMVWTLRSLYPELRRYGRRRWRICFH